MLNDLYQVLQLVQTAVLVGLSIVAIGHWRRRKATGAGWIAATFGTLGAVGLVAPFLDDGPDSQLATLVTKAAILVLVLFPYFLFRFLDSLLPAKAWTRLGVKVLLAAIVVAALSLQEVPGRNDPSTASFQAFLLGLAVYWTTLSIGVAMKLWVSGRGQPTVSRRRMRTLSLGSIAMTIAILVSAAIRQASNPEIFRNLNQVVVMFAAGLFLLGFAPPRSVVAAWRRKDDLALRQAEIDLVKAVTPKEVAEGLLPNLSKIVGAKGAALIDTEGRSLGSYGEPLNLHETDGIVEVALERGRLLVKISPLAPFFGLEERKTMEALGVLTDLALARARLFEREKQNVEAMRDFVAIASHDLRTPITVIGGLSHTLNHQWERLEDEMKQDLISRINRQTGQLSRMVEDLLTVSKIEAGVMEVIAEDVNIASVVAEVLQDLEIEPGSVEVRVDPDLTALTDRDHLSRMVRNFLSNALNYGAPPTVIEATGAGGRVEIEVRDSGMGVPEEFESQLFEKFARADKKMSRATQGTGLGLSIVKGLAEASRGHVYYRRNEPRGAIFGVRLPSSDPQ